MIDKFEQLATKLAGERRVVEAKLTGERKAVQDELEAVVAETRQAQDALGAERQATADTVALVISERDHEIAERAKGTERWTHRVQEAERRLIGEEAVKAQAIDAAAAEARRGRN